MKFTKTAVAVAIAGIASAPMMAAAEVTLSGATQINFQGDDTDTDEGEVQFAAGDVNINLNARQTTNAGATAYANYRLDADAFSGDPLTGDSIHLGISGGFGDLRFGETKVIAEYGQVANDIFDITGDVNDGVTYEGSFGGVTLGLGWSPEQNTDVVAAGAKFAIGGFSVGAGFEDRAGDTAFSVGASFGFAGASISGHFGSSETDAVGDDSREIFGVQVGYGIAGVGLSVTFMNQANGIEGFFENAIRLDASYDLGGGLGLSGRVTSQTGGNAVGGGDLEDLVEYRVQLSKSF